MKREGVLKLSISVVAAMVTYLLVAMSSSKVPYGFDCIKG